MLKQLRKQAEKNSQENGNHLHWEIKQIADKLTPDELQELAAEKGRPAFIKSSKDAAKNNAMLAVARRHAESAILYAK